VRVGIIGITGKVGAALRSLISNDSEIELVGGYSRQNSISDLENLAINSDVLIDFSLPDATMMALEIASRIATPFVSGTTGISEENFRKILKFSEKIPILHASNFSIGIPLMAILMKKCAAILADFDITLIEKHHRHKKDSPSGTALFLVEQIEQNAQILSVRAGNGSTEHTCGFYGENETLTISHQTFGRDVFARGALACAKWIIGKKPKMYAIQDYINAKNPDVAGRE
jgi:4-hydroxy-tetrahydrodipicolinate reductase